MKLTCKSTAIADVLLLQPQVFEDERGFFTESFNQRDFALATGLDVTFVQDNHSKSVQGVLRGMHFQLGKSQAKLVRVTQGSVFDVAVDLRRSSPTFGQWVGNVLSAQNHCQHYIPAGFAHGFLVLSETAEVQYKVSDYWSAQHEHVLAWNDPTVSIDWPVTMAPLLSVKDQQGLSWQQLQVLPSLII